MNYMNYNNPVLFPGDDGLGPAAPRSTGYLPSIFDGRTLKILAVISMLIDHIGVALYPNIMLLRYIGRLAFPIYCFLLVEGAFHTHDIRKYLRNLLIFAAISEIPFNMMLKGRFFYFPHQNVFLTLAAGIIMIMLFRLADRRYPETSMRQVLYAGIYILIGGIAQILHFDYGMIGIGFIFVFYQLRSKPIMKYLLFAIMCIMSNKTEIFAIMAIVFLDMYSGKRGQISPTMKKAFYMIYPIHLLILGLLRMYM